MKRWALAPALLAIVALGDAGPGRATVPVDTCARTRPEQVLAGEVGGRPVLVHEPAQKAGTRLPLVVALHGYRRTGEWMQEYSGLSAAADRAGFIVAYPTARTDAAGWPLVRRDARDEADDIRDFIDLAGSELCADPDRVFATGVSNGAGMAARLGCELADRLTAIAPVSGGYGSLSGPCRPSRPLSVLEIHGAADPVVPYYGKPPVFVGSVLRWLGGWRSLDHCPGRAARSAMSRYRAQKLVWRGCTNRTVVEHYRLRGVGHTWPGSPQDRQSAFPAADIVLRFFASLPRG